MPYQTDNSVRGGAAITWDPITGATAGDSLEVGYSTGLAAAVQVIGGTPGSVTLQGSLDNINWANLSDVDGVAIALTQLTQLEDFTTAARYIRPRGDAASVDAIVRVVLRS
jgi:hypothetical protein